MPAKIMRLPASRRPLTIAENLAILRVVLLGEPVGPSRRAPTERGA
jgi:hypothetical protein